jgi:Domain of unknown function (DUF4129)
LLLLFGENLPAQTAEVTVSDQVLKPSTLDSYTAHLQSLHALVAACAQQSTACDSSKVGADEHVTLANKASFDVHYAWIGAALDSAKPLPDQKRDALMNTIEARLDADLADAQPAWSSADFATARKDANAILAGREFNTSVEPSLRDRIMAILFRWLDRLLERVAAFGSSSPWIAPLLEWFLGSLACALLLVWAFRTVRRQRLRMQIDSVRTIEQTEERVLNWMREAEEHAAREDFRDAVHCLYWASIATLEGRRFWQPDRARTPREYLRLLDPASAVAPLLRRQTFSFESIWYGLRPAARPDYDHALQLHRQLRSA